MKYFKHIFISCALITIALIAFKNNKEETLEKQKEQIILDYYKNVETLLDSLNIYESSTIFNTDIGNRYLESKHKFNSLIIMTSSKEEEQMKPLRRLLTIIIFLLFGVFFIFGIIVLIPMQYIFTGKTNIMNIVTKKLDELINRINPDK